MILVAREEDGNLVITCRLVTECPLVRFQLPTFSEELNGLRNIIKCAARGVKRLM